MSPSPGLGRGQLHLDGVLGPCPHPCTWHSVASGGEWRLPAQLRQSEGQCPQWLQPVLESRLTSNGEACQTAAGPQSVQAGLGLTCASNQLRACHVLVLGHQSAESPGEMVSGFTQTSGQRSGGNHLGVGGMGHSEVQATDVPERWARGRTPLVLEPGRSQPSLRGEASLIRAPLSFLSSSLALQPLHNKWTMVRQRASSEDARALAGLFLFWLAPWVVRVESASSLLSWKPGSMQERRAWGAAWHQSSVMSMTSESGQI